MPAVTSIGDGEIVRGWDRIRERMDVLDSLTAMQGHLTLTLGSLDVTPLRTGYALAIALYTLAVGAQGADARQRGAMTLVLEKVGGSRRTSTTILVRRPYAGVEALKRRHRGFRHRQLRTLSKTNNTFGAEWSRRLRNLHALP